MMCLRIRHKTSLALRAALESHGNIISNLDRKKRCKGDNLLHTTGSTTFVWRMRKSHPSYSSKQLCWWCFESLSPFFTGFHLVFVVNLGGESPKQILARFFCSSNSRGNIRIFLMEKRKLGSVLRKRGSWKPLVVSTDGKFTMQSLQVSLSLSFPFSTNSFSNHTID